MQAKEETKMPKNINQTREKSNNFTRQFKQGLIHSTVL